MKKAGWMLLGWMMAMTARGGLVTFVVESASVPDGAQVYLAGSATALGGWKADGVALEHKGGGRWSKALELPEGEEIEFKCTLGSWGTEALLADGTIPPNGKLMVRGESQEVLIPVARWKESAPSGRITGTVKVHPDMSYPGLLPRTVHVWLPPGYEEETGQRYPVLYMHDGQQVFDPETSTHGIDWQVDETATRLIEEGKMQKILVVAVNCTSNRFRDYSETPEGAAYQAFLAAHLKPFIDRTYRTLPDRAHTAVMGASMGGRISFLLAWNHPETFSMAGCLSPSFDEELTVRVAGESGPAPALFFYLDNGGIGLEKKLQEGCDQMLSALEQRGFVRDGNLVWAKDEGAEHNEAAWARRVHVPLLLMFGTGAGAWRPGSIPEAPQ